MFLRSSAFPKGIDFSRNKGLTGQLLTNTHNMNTPRLLIACSFVAVVLSGCNENAVKNLEIQYAKNDSRIDSIEKEFARISSEHLSREESIRKEIGANSSKVVSLESDVEKLKLELGEAKSDLATATNENVQFKSSMESIRGLLQQIKSVDQRSLEALEERRVKLEAKAAPIREKMENLGRQRAEELKVALELAKRIERVNSIEGTSPHAYEDTKADRDQANEVLSRRLINSKEAIRQLDVAIQNERDRLNDLNSAP
jgi:chromosome segregation ATPase